MKLDELTDAELERRFIEAERNALEWIGMPGRHAEHQSEKWMTIAQGCRAETERRATMPRRVPADDLFALPDASVERDRELPQLFDGGVLRLLVRRARATDAIFEAVLAARAGDEVAGFALSIGWPNAAVVRSLGAPSDVFARVLRADHTMRKRVACNAIMHASITPRDLFARDVDLALQFGTLRSTFLPVAFAGDHVVIRLTEAHRSHLVAKLTVKRQEPTPPRRRRP